MSILLSASTCTVESEQGEHLFKILDHSLHRGMGVGHYIQSSCFTVGGHEWCIRYYPDGRDGPTEDNKDAITLVLELVEMDPNEERARVSCTISIFDWRTKRFSSLVAFTEKFSNADCLVTRTIDRATVEASDYVVDDRLTLKCAMTVIKEPYVLEDHIEVPPSDITEQLGKLLDAKEGADVTFEVQGEELPAHKLVLAMRSPVFKALLYGPMKEKDSNRVIIDDMQPAIFKVLLHFIYTDSLPPKMDDDLEGDDKKEVTRHLLVAADRYAMERLKLMCENILCKDLDAESVATVLALADQHSCSGLKDACIRFIASCTKIDDVVASRGYIQLKRSCPDSVMEMWETACKLRKI
ncbi:BTB/POZ and MATH domain-containing protein 2-like [Lolium rigidum]|uniref:BTB/POZ and MATH domain-containing protein 2-like n=1 Tax=Lolium rigidum TaxID=89674 RepID=UPI001F5C8271|nr:BTB/POZ and MATH domain-containing protein 2-like [Lolium rigidum]